MEKIYKDKELADLLAKLKAVCIYDESKKELYRIIRTPEGQILFDSTGKLSGRGAYICPDSGCLAKAKKARRIERAFECPISDELYEEFENGLSEKIFR